MPTSTKEDELHPPQRTKNACMRHPSRVEVNSMFCPQCHDEYREGFTECAECHVPLVEELPKEPIPPPPSELITVFTTGDAALLPVIESVLNGAGIRFFAKNERLNDLFGWGRIGTGFNVITGPVEIQVASEDAEVARKMLHPLNKT